MEKEQTSKDVIEFTCLLLFAADSLVSSLVCTVDPNSARGRIKIGQGVLTKF